MYARNCSAFDKTRVFSNALQFRAWVCFAGRSFSSSTEGNLKWSQLSLSRFSVLRYLVGSFIASIPSVPVFLLAPKYRTALVSRATRWYRLFYLVCHDASCQQCTHKKSRRVDLYCYASACTQLRLCERKPKTNTRADSGQCGEEDTCSAGLHIAP